MKTPSRRSATAVVDTVDLPTRERMEWLLEFAFAELEQLTESALRTMARETLNARPLAASGINHSVAASGMLLEIYGKEKSFPKYTLATLGPLQAGLRDGLERLKKGNDWPLPEVPVRMGIVPARIDLIEHLAGRADDDSPYLVRRIHASFEAAFYVAAQDTLLAWWHKARTCAADDCERLILPSDARQMYCSTACSKRTRWARFAPNRVRDYSAEYAQRVHKHVGPRVKVSRNRKRGA